MDIKIRLEKPKDYKTVEELTREAFWNQHAPGCDEHYLVHVMRNHADFVPELDLVAEADGVIVGNIMYTKARLVDAAGNEKQILSFGPLSVLPQYQRMGVGKALQEQSFQMAAEMGYDVIVIFGHPSNYVARGFVSCAKFHIGLQGIYPTAMLVKELRPNALDGRNYNFIESEIMAVDAKAAEAYDTLFPLKEKRYQKSQEEFYIYSHSRICGIE